MLTIKGPVELHIAQPSTANADAFSERIRGNYGLIGAHFTPKDLLFLMTAPPELPEGLGGMTTLIQQENHVDVRGVTMDVVNHVVNRILLDGTTHFTYQDQVYITTVLNRLGITNVAQFMEQVRQLRMESESTTRLTKLYHSELERVLEKQAAGERVPPLPLPPERAEEQPPQHQDPATTLSLSILNRLNTAQLCQTIHAFQQSWTGGSMTLRNQELKLSEQLRLSNTVSLAEIKQQLYQQPRLELTQHLNIYETGEALAPPADEEQVLSQAAAATLLSTVDHTVVEVLHRPQYRAEQWVQIKNALWQTAENSISRFELYRTEPERVFHTETRTDSVWYSCARELMEYQTLHQILRSGEGQTSVPHSGGDGEGPEAPALIWQYAESGEEPAPAISERTETERLERQTHTEKRESHRTDTAHTEAVRETLRVLRERGLRQETQHLRELLLRRFPAALQPPTGEAQPLPLTGLTPREAEETLLTERLRETRDTLRQEQLRSTERETLEHLRERSHTETRLTQQKVTLPQEPQDAAQPAHWTEAAVPPAVMTPHEAETQAPEVLTRELERIDRHNRTILQAVQEKSIPAQPVLPERPNMQETMRTALRAMEEPETVLRELYETRSAQQAELTHPELTPREAALMEQASPQERAVYEAVLAYQKDPEQAVARGLLRPASQAALQAALLSASQEEPLHLAHPAEDGVLQQEEIRFQPQELLERIVHIPAAKTAVRQEQAAPPSAVRIVHKQQPPDVTEELLEQLDQQRRSETVRTETTEHVTRQQEHQVDVKQVERKMVTQTTEDITELVNRALSRQMRTISDQVYRQMEKRLQTERSRRGRL